MLNRNRELGTLNPEPVLILSPERGQSSRAGFIARLDIGGHVVSYISRNRSESNLRIAVNSKLKLEL